MDYVFRPDDPPFNLWDKLNCAYILASQLCHKLWHFLKTLNIETPNKGLLIIDQLEHRTISCRKQEMSYQVFTRIPVKNGFYSLIQVTSCSEQLIWWVIMSQFSMGQKMKPTQFNFNPRMLQATFVEAVKEINFINLVKGKFKTHCNLLWTYYHNLILKSTRCT